MISNLHRSAGLLLDHGRARSDASAADDVANLDCDEVAATKFAVDRQIEQRLVAQTPTPFTSANVRRATCSYKNSTGAPMSVTISGDAWACPFPASSDVSCTKAIEARDSGDFALKRKRA